MESKEPTLSLEEIDALESAYLSSCQNLHQKARSAYSTTGFLGKYLCIYIINLLIFFN